MSDKTMKAINCRRVELDGVRYVILRESIFDALCRKADVSLEDASEGAQVGAEELEGADLAEKLIRRRKAAGLGQAELARRAGIRPETLNRIERGRTTPDFTTIRKLVLAMDAAERAAAERAAAEASLTNEEPENQS